MLSLEENALKLSDFDGLSFYDKCLVRESINMLAMRVIKLFSSQTTPAVINHKVLLMLM